MEYDVIIIGGSFAGLSAAMPLVRAQRRVLLLDANQARNRFANTTHGIFGLDGKRPDEIRNTVLSQLKAYPTFTHGNTLVTNVELGEEGFTVSSQDRPQYHSKKVILATGIVDVLPNIPDIENYWGKTILHCPYCHGYELRNREQGVYATSDMSVHQAVMLPDWGNTTLFTQGKYEPVGDILKLINEREVKIERSPIISVVGKGSELTHVVLDDNREVPIGALYVGPRIAEHSPLVKTLGLALANSPFGEIIQVDEWKESSMKGLFVAGDLSTVMQSGSFAVSSGNLAGIAAHRSLIFN